MTKGVVTIGVSRWFTLIELLVVIGIIAILAAMLLAALSVAQRKGDQAVCVGNLKQMALGFELYLADADDVFPRYAHGDAGEKQYEAWMYYEDLEDEDDGADEGCTVFLPQYGTMYGYITSSQDLTTAAEVYRCPSDDTISLVSYGVNSRTCGEEHATGGLERGIRLQLLKDPSFTTLLMEETSPRGTGGPPTTNDAYLNVEYGTEKVANRHNRGSVYSFCDGHVLWHRWTKETEWRSHCELQSQ